MLAWGRGLAKAQTALRLGPPQVVLLAAGAVAMALSGYVTGATGAACGLVASALLGALQVCAHFDVARLLARLTPAASGVVLGLGSVACACACALYTLADAPWAVALPPLLLAMGALFAGRADRLMPIVALAGKDENRAEVLGVFRLPDCVRAATAVACTFILGCVTLAGCSWPGDAPGPVLAAVLVALACVCVVTCALFTSGGLRSMSMTFAFRVGLPPLFVGATALFIVVTTGGDVAAWAVPVVFLVALGLLAAGQGHQIMAIGGMRSGAALVDMAALVLAGQSVGAAAATLMHMLGPYAAQTDAQLSSGVVLQLLVTLLAVAFVACIPAHEPHIVGPGGASHAPQVPPKVDRFDRFALPAMQFGLTARETEVFVLLAQGVDAPEIAERLRISRATVNTHIQHIYAKAGVHSKVELFARSALDLERD